MEIKANENNNLKFINNIGRGATNPIKIFSTDDPIFKDSPITEDCNNNEKIEYFTE